jgi:nucleoside diphosphate kinase
MNGKVRVHIKRKGLKIVAFGIKHVQAKLTEEEYNEFYRIARQNGASMQEVLRSLIVKYNNENKIEKGS